MLPSLSAILTLSYVLAAQSAMPASLPRLPALLPSLVAPAHGFLHPSRQKNLLCRQTAEAIQVRQSTAARRAWILLLPAVRSKLEPQTQHGLLQHLLPRFGRPVVSARQAS